jgi:hypothetical protein
VRRCSAERRRRDRDSEARMPYTSSRVWRLNDVLTIW